MAVGAVPKDRYERQMIVHADERERAGGHVANWTGADGYRSAPS
jgi:hypothetical protein